MINVYKIINKSVITYPSTSHRSFKHNISNMRLEDITALFILYHEGDTSCRGKWRAPGRGLTPTRRQPQSPPATLRWPQLT